MQQSHHTLKINLTYSEKMIILVKLSRNYKIIIIAAFQVLHCTFHNFSL